jgi:hypothetical protein
LRFCLGHGEKLGVENFVAPDTNICIFGGRPTKYAINNYTEQVATTACSEEGMNKNIPLFPTF